MTEKIVKKESAQPSKKMPKREEKQKATRMTKEKGAEKGSQKESKSGTLTQDPSPALKTEAKPGSGVRLSKATAEDFEMVKFPLISEKAVNMIETENKLTFVTSKRATKSLVKETIERVYGVKVDSVNMVNDMKGRKKAIVKINKAFKAEEVATKLGVI
ncbi:MAG: 50S ribosomal protein L23 [Candidatus Diapherotrites archaeon]|nr:50S ribosomal protein L23 [Candidatus Diapherotrites archaeon]